ncbi:MAG: adenylate/guanylate cyclase domain-containing protein [Rhizobiaceae bacterium]
MTTLGNWLSARNLDSLEAQLAENEIDLDILFELTDDEFREIGLSLGARKRLRSAIKEAASEGAQNETAPQKPVPGEAERRQLTTVFIDLIGSTALSAQLDPEDMREVITLYQNTVAGIVTRFSGHVAKFMGDGVLCYFGWPSAHEDDAKRAARAGLEIASTIDGTTAPNGQKLGVRIGIATGVVVVGDLIGEGAAQEEAVVGDTPNLAARLQGVAEPGQIVVSATTRQLLGHDFDLKTLSPLELKGIEGSTHAWAVEAERSPERRFDLLEGDPVLPMIGRSHELALIMERWQRAGNGEGQMIVLTGEAGIGKSRLTRAVIEEVQKGEHYRLSYYCSPYHVDSSFYPVVQQLKDAFSLQESGDVAHSLDLMESGLLAADPKIMAELLQIDASQRYGALQLTPQQVRNQILEEMAKEVRALSRERPVLVVVEDAHWIDASTLEMLEACLDTITGERTLILITARPTFSHGFGGHPIVSKLALNRLGADQTENILRKITNGKRLPPELVAEINSRTDGVPLFIEELTKTILESGELRETENSYELTGPIGRMTIPATLHDSLMARIDRLQPIKEVAQMAACIGRSFDRSALIKVSRLDDQAMDEALAQLEQSELVFRRGTPPDASYVFKHALVRDVAYESLLKRKRQEIHRGLVDVFEADPASPQEITAHHATEAGLIEKAALLWREAAGQAQARPAYQEASNQLKTALMLIEQLADKPGWPERELEVLVQLAQIHIAKDGYASAEASLAFAKALERIDVTDNQELRVAIYYGTWITPYIANQLHRANELVSRLVKEMEREPEPVPRLISLRMRAATLISMGSPAQALEDLEAAYALYQSAQIDDFSAKFAQDPGVQIWSYVMLAKWMLGDLEGATDTADRALTRARELKHANTICYAGLHDIALSFWTGNTERARATTDEMRRLANEHDMALWKLYSDISDAVIACMSDEPGATEQLDSCLVEYKESGCWLWITIYLAEKAKTLLRSGDAAAAEATIERALSEASVTGETWAEAELHRIRGDILKFMDDHAGAQAEYETATSIAQEQGIKSLQDRAGQSLVQLQEQ